MYAALASLSELRSHIASLERSARGSVVALEMDDQGDKLAGGAGREGGLAHGRTWSVLSLVSHFDAGWRRAGPCRYSPLVSQLEAGWRRAGPCRYYASVDVPSVLSHCWLGGKKGTRPVKTGRWGAGVVICLERSADLHMAQLMPLPLTVSCFSKVQTGFTVLVPAGPVVPDKRLNGRVGMQAWMSDLVGTSPW